MWPLQGSPLRFARLIKRRFPSEKTAATAALLSVGGEMRVGAEFSEIAILSTGFTGLALLPLKR